MKPERKTLMAIFAMLAAALLAGCSDGSDGGSSANDTITAATAETITDSDLEGTKWSYSYTYTSDGVPGTGTMTIEFQPGGNVTIRDVYDGGSNEENYTYTVDGSTVTIYDGREKWGELIYLSDQLVYVQMAFSLEGSSGSGSAVSLAGTTWTCDTIVYKFGSDGTVTSYVDGGQNSSPSTANYTVSGSTVTILVGGEAVQELIYMSGKLISGTIYTKD